MQTAARYPGPEPSIVAWGSSNKKYSVMYKNNVDINVDLSHGNIPAVINSPCEKRCSTKLKATSSTPAKLSRTPLPASNPRRPQCTAKATPTPGFILGDHLIKPSPRHETSVPSVCWVQRLHQKPSN